MPVSEPTDTDKEGEAGDGEVGVWEAARALLEVLVFTIWPQTLFVPSRVNEEGEATEFADDGDGIAPALESPDTGAPDGYDHTC